jgi:hypothetical protein
MTTSENGDSGALSEALDILNDHWTKLLGFVLLSLICVGFSFSDPNSRTIEWGKGPKLSIPRETFAIGLICFLAVCIFAFVVVSLFVAKVWKDRVQGNKPEAYRKEVKKRQEKYDGPIPSKDFPSEPARGDWALGWAAMLLMFLIPLALSIYALLRLIPIVS